MATTLNLIETTTELGLEVVEVIVASSSTPGPAGPGVPTGGTLNQVLTKDSGTDYDTSWQDPQGASGGAPDDVDYLVGTASGDLSAEIVVGTSPGGELGGTWASPTVDTTHSGSSHASVQAAAEATAASALATHSADTTGVHGITDTSALALTANHPSNATFNDHSARHENGGADEISIAGLDGTSVELAAHLADAADAHDATAISFAPAGSISATTVQAAIEEVATEAGSGSGEALQRSIAQTAHGFDVGDVVLFTGGEFALAQANSAANSEVIGIVAEDTDADNFVLHYGGRITGLSGLTADTVYFLDDDTPGLLTATEPTDAGDVSKPLLVADSTTSGYFYNYRGAVVLDIATQAELDAHINDTSDAHDASSISVLDSAGYFPGTDVETVLAFLAARGTSFPGSPSTDDRFYRTDRDLVYFYDGTRWLTVAEYTMPLVVRTAIGSGISATSTLANAPTRMSAGDMWIEDLRTVVFNSGTSDGSNYWTITLDKLTSANVATNVGTVSTQNDTTSIWVEHVDAVDEVVAGSAHLAFRVVATKVASAGNLLCGIEITYRLVG